MTLPQTGRESGNETTRGADFAYISVVLISTRCGIALRQLDMYPHPDTIRSTRNPFQGNRRTTTTLGWWQLVACVAGHLERKLQNRFDLIDGHLIDTYRLTHLCRLVADDGMRTVLLEEKKNNTIHNMEVHSQKSI